MQLPPLSEVVALLRAVFSIITTGALITLLGLPLLSLDRESLEKNESLARLYVSRIPWQDQTVGKHWVKSSEDARHDILASIAALGLGIGLMWTVLPAVGIGVVAANLFVGIGGNPESAMRATAAFILIFTFHEHQRYRAQASVKDWYQLP